MGFLAPALPWIVKGGAALAGVLGGRKAQSSAQKRSPEESAALGGAQSTAAGLTSTGQDLVGQGKPYIRQAGDYYSTLLRGNRAAQAQATAAPRAAISDTYAGAERGLERSGVRGAQKQVASGELARGRASQIAGLTTGVQPAAADALANLGTTVTGQGGSLMQGAGGIYSNLLGQGFQNRVYARGEGEKAGSSIGGFIFDILSGGLGKKAPGAAGRAIPTMPVREYDFPAN